MKPKKRKSPRPRRRYRLGQATGDPELDRTFIRTQVSCQNPGEVLDIGDAIAERSGCVFNIYCDVDEGKIVFVAECPSEGEHRRFKKIIKDAEVR